MDRNLHDFIMTVVLSFFIGTVVGGTVISLVPDPRLLLSAKAEARKELLIDAVKAGIAEWQIIDDAGNTAIRFKVPEAEKLLGEEKP
jgi:hypothetical protein